MTFLQMQTEVLRRLDESSRAPHYWSLQDIKDALNEGYAEISDASEWYERNATISLLSNRTYYNLMTVLSDTILTLKHAYSNQSSRWLRPTNTRELDFNTYSRWEVSTEEPDSFFIRGLWWLGVFPKKGSDTGTIKLYYTALPADLSADADTPAFPQEYHLGIVYYAIYDLLIQDGEASLAAEFWTKYMTVEEALSAYAARRIARDRVWRTQ